MHIQIGSCCLLTVNVLHRTITKCNLQRPEMQQKCRIMHLLAASSSPHRAGRCLMKERNHKALGSNRMFRTSDTHQKSVDPCRRKWRPSQHYTCPRRDPRRPRHSHGLGRLSAQPRRQRAPPSRSRSRTERRLRFRWLRRRCPLRSGTGQYIG